MTAEKKTAYHRDEVTTIINSVISKITDNTTHSQDLITRELFDLKNAIDELRQQLGGLETLDISTAHIPSAHDELDAVITMTEQASSTIMEACESIARLTEPLKNNEVEAEITKIFEACTFQDITGQRITKVIKTLKTIDNKVAGLLGILGAYIPSDTRIHAQPVVQTNSLLNGPGLAHETLSQDDIDRLLEM